jgi:sulfate adenylyltransferase subunit 1
MGRDLLRFATAGSVDDGKSTLVGRLLYDTKSVLADQIEAVHRASVDKGLSTPDLSLLVDGLRAEREQGITIDVAYRYFATPQREFVLADTPGHVQYTRNTVTGASTAELAVLLVDARNGVVEQTRRHAAVLALLRVPRLVLAINKIDLVDYDEAVLTAIGKDFAGLTRSLGFPDDAVVTIPVSALVGDNVVQRSARTPWYDGPTLLGHLESVPVTDPDVAGPFRMPVQYVIRPRTAELPDYRGYAGQVAAGSVAPGDEVVVLPGGARTTVSAVDTADGPLSRAGVGRSVTVLLADDIDISRGDLLAAADAPPPVTAELDATLCWLADRPLRPGARLLLKHGTRTTQVIVGMLGDRLDTETVSWVDPPAQLGINDIARVSLRTADPLPVDDYAVIRATGAFLLIDPPTGNTLAAGLIGAPLTLPE